MPNLRLALAQVDPTVGDVAGNSALVRQWAEGDPVGVASTGLDVETVCVRAAAVHPDLAEVWAPFAGRFAELVRTAARTGAGAA